MTTLDRQSKEHAFLTLADGSVFDVYGDNWVEIVADADCLAEHLGVAIDVYNSELPEV
jgi:hypothetical protein